MLLIDSACLPSKFFLLHLLDFFQLPEVPDATEIFERTLDDGYRGESETEPPSSEPSPKNSEQIEEVEVEDYEISEALTKSMHKAEVKEEEVKEHDEEKAEKAEGEKNDGEDHPSCEDSIHQKEEEGDAGVRTDKAERDIPKSTKKGKKKKKKKDKTKKENDEDRDRSFRRSYSRGYSRDSYSRGRYSRRYDSRSLTPRRSRSGLFEEFMDFMRYRDEIRHDRF